MKDLFKQYMNADKKKKIIIDIDNSTKSFRKKNIRLGLIFFTGIFLIPLHPVKSEELFLKCSGRYEINRGQLIRPDWETSYISINLNGLKSTIVEKGLEKEGKTLIRRNSYTITHRDNRNRLKTKYKIHRIHGTYVVDYPLRNRTLIGTCQKGKG